MSFKAFVWAWDQDVPNGDHQHVLLALANIAPVREVRASVGYIARQVRRSPRKVRAALEWLARAEIISVTPRPGMVDLIRINVPKGFTVQMDEDEEGDREVGTRGRPRKTPVSDITKPLQNPCPRGAGEPIEEPEGEPKRPSDEGLSAASADASPARIAFDTFNATATALGWGLALKLTDQRRGALNARMKETGGLDGWREALLRAERSPFLSGRTHHRFAISLDFLLQPSSFTKLIEGFYDDERQPTATPGHLNGRAANHDRRTDAMLAGAASAFGARGEHP